MQAKEQDIIFNNIHCTALLQIVYNKLTYYIILLDASCQTSIRNHKQFSKDLLLCHLELCVFKLCHFSIRNTEKKREIPVIIPVRISMYISLNWAITV